MKKQVIGIDISKDRFDFCSLDIDSLKVDEKGIITNQKSFIDDWLTNKSNDSVVFALEHTGHYGTALIHCLAQRGFDFYLINPLDLKKSLGIQRGKTDAKDAYRIAEYSIIHRHRLKYHKLPSKALRSLKPMITARERYVKISVQIQNSLKANEILNKSVDVQILVKEEQKQLKSIKMIIKKLDKQIQKLINEDADLRETYQKITKVIGVGPVIAASCIVATDNFTTFTDPRKFNCYCGLAPFPYQSGSSIKGKTKTHHFRNKTLKALLTKAAVTAMVHDPQIKAFYNRKMKEGKHHMCIKNAIANKIVLRIFAVVKRDEPFVKFAA
jgi:transposase